MNTYLLMVTYRVVDELELSVATDRNTVGAGF